MSDGRPDEHVLIESSDLVLVTADHATGELREDRLRFAYDDGRIYLLARADESAGWYRNVEKDRGVVLRVKRRGFRGRASLIDARQRASLATQVVTRFKRKYGAEFQPGKLGDWLPVVIAIEF